MEKETVCYIYESGLLLCKTTTHSIHEKVSDEIKDKYELRKSTMILKYDPTVDMEVDHCFAQILEHVEKKGHDYLVISNASWVDGDASSNLRITNFSTDESAWNEYEKVLKFKPHKPNPIEFPSTDEVQNEGMELVISDEWRQLVGETSSIWKMYVCVNNGTIKRKLVGNVDLISFEQTESESERSFDVSGNTAAKLDVKYEDFDDETKQMIKLLIPETTEGSSRMALGFPTPSSVELAKKLLNIISSRTYFVGSKKSGASNVLTAVEASSLFHILTAGYCGDERLPLIYTKKQIEEKRRLITALQSKACRDEMKLSYPAKVEVILGRLGYRLKRVKENDNFFLTRIRECIKNQDEVDKPQSSKSVWTRGFHYELVDVFSFDTSSTPLTVDLNNALLWHGTSKGNIISILQNGYDCSTRGGVFGRGIYFTDAAAKALMYTQFGTEVILLLNEVQLGNCKNDHLSFFWDTTQGKVVNNSIKGVGRVTPDPNGDMIDEYGATFHSGKLLFNGSFPSKGADVRFNEYVAHKKSQVKVRYIVRLSLKNKNPTLADTQQNMNLLFHLKSLDKSIADLLE